MACPDLWRALLVSASLLVLSSADLQKVLEKAAAMEAVLQARIAEQSCPSEESSTGECADLYLQWRAAKKIVAFTDTSPTSSAEWKEVLEALQTLPAYHLSDDPEALKEQILSEELTHDDIRALGVLVSDGVDVGDSYFWDDEREYEVEEVRRLDNTWQGPRIAAGRPWVNRTMVFYYDLPVHWTTKLAMSSAIKEITSKTCIKFREVTYEEGQVIDHVVKVTDDKESCHAHVGMINADKQNRPGGQSLNLGLMCRFHKIAVHEILHSLGCKHEQSRSDRDYFLEIVYDNILEAVVHNFNKGGTTYTTRPYDYRSIMHYTRYAFSKDAWQADQTISWTLSNLAKYGIEWGSPTMKARNPEYSAQLGSGSLTDGDTEQLLDMYQCAKMAASSTGSAGWSITWNAGLEIGSGGDQSVGVACNGGYAVASCSCYHDGAQCRGATLTEVTGGTCVAVATGTAIGNVKAHAICVKLASPHYATALISKEESSGSATQSCPPNYKRVGCSCFTSTGSTCNAVPVPGSESCSATSSKSVQVQASCLRSPALSETQLVGAAPSTESVAQCPAGKQLLGCSCSGSSPTDVCKGARPGGEDSNSCFAYAKESSHSVIAHAICGVLADYGEANLTTAEFLDGGSIVEGVPSTLQAVQNLYCNSTGAFQGISKHGCGGIAAQTRSVTKYACDSRTCQEAQLEMSQADQVTITVGEDGNVNCPAGWLVTSVVCVDNCRSFQLTCNPPLLDSGWFLSGGRTHSGWFNGNSGSAMGTCGQAVAIGLECADASLLRDTSCYYVRLRCRQIALANTDEAERHADFDMSFAEPQWTEYISETGWREAAMQFQFYETLKGMSENPTFLPVRKVQCRGEWCDELRFELPTKFGSQTTYEEMVGTPTVWTTKFRGDTEMVCPGGHYVAGMNCRESFCHQKEMICAMPLSQNWVVTSNRYYSHCFTNKALMSWMNWFRDRVHNVWGGRKTCAGMSPSDMPDSQSCGEDGVMVGLSCWGGDCDRLQLVCASIEASPDVTSNGALSPVAGGSVNAYYDDMSTWEWKKQNDGEPSLARWDGTKLISPEDGDSIPISAAQTRRFALAAMLVISALLGR